MIDQLQRRDFACTHPIQPDDTESPEEQTADELLGRFRTEGLTPALALKVAEFIHGQTAGQSAPSGDIRADIQENLWLSLCRMIEAPKTKFSLGCFMLALGRVHRSVRSERQWAIDRGVSPTHVSNEVRTWQQILGLPKTEFQKSAAACAKYRTHNRARIAAS